LAGGAVRRLGELAWRWSGPSAEGGGQAGSAAELHEEADEYVDFTCSTSAVNNKN